MPKSIEDIDRQIAALKEQKKTAASANRPEKA